MQLRRKRMIRQWKIKMTLAPAVEDSGRWQNLGLETLTGEGRAKGRLWVLRVLKEDPYLFPPGRIRIGGSQSAW